MEIIHYEVGQIPLRNLTMTVKGSYGRPANLSVYTDISVRMLGSDNEEVDLTGLNVNRGGASLGKVVLEWPRNRSLFTKSGEYLVQLILRTADGAKDITSPQLIRVRELGKVNR